MSDAPDWAKDETASQPDWAKEETPVKPPAMFLSTPDASGRMTAEPSTTYNEPEKPKGIVQRAKEGAMSAYEEPLGFSPDSIKRYPWLGWMQQHVPAITAADAALRAPGAIWGGLSGAASGAAEPVIGSAQADRLQRDLHSLPQAAAGEVPVAAPKMLPAREVAQTVEREVKPPPLPAEAFPNTPRQVARPDVGVDLLPVETPHELPPERSALSAAGHGGPLSDVSPETIAHMRSVMEEQGFTPHTIDQRLAEMSAHHFFGEITPSLESDMGAVAAPPGPGKIEVLGSLRQRATEARERTQHEFDRAFGVHEDVAQLRRVMEADRDQAAEPFYREFRQRVVDPTPEIDALLPRLRASGSLQHANRALAEEGLPSANGFIDREGTGAGEQRVPTTAAFQYAKEHLDSLINKAVEGGNRNDARRYTALKNDLVSTLDNHPEVGDVWRQARETYAQPTEIMDSMRTGRRVLTNHIDADELPFLTAGYSEAQMRGLRIGMRAQLEQMLGKRDALTAETINTVLSPNNIRKLRWAIGDERAESLVGAMEHERHMHTAPTRVYGGSPTALRQEAQKRWTVQPGTLDKVSLSDVAGAVAHPVKSVAGVAEKFGLSQRRAAKEAKMARLREESARIFTLQGPERDAVARYLVGGEQNGAIDLAERRRQMRPGFARGGPVRRYADGGAPGMIEPGNIDLASRPVVKNSDGSISTVRSLGINEDGREILIPTVSHDGTVLSNDDAVRLYRMSGKHLGVFDTPENSTGYAKQLHEDQEKLYRARGGAVHNSAPTEAQKRAGNYAKTHKYFHGLDITIENLKGRSRSGVGKDGKPWSVRMPAHYGYIKRTEGADGDHVDCYLGPNLKSDQVFVVDQKDDKTGRFDEHKCLLAFNSEREAKATYLAGFSDGKNRIKHMRRMTVSEFKDWLKQGDTSKPIKAQDVGLRLAFQVRSAR